MAKTLMLALALLVASSAWLTAQSPMNPHTRTRAEAKIVVLSSEGKPYDHNGKIELTWFVVPGSGTGDLSGLRGEGGLEGDFGKGSAGTLDYWFE